jgi:hypothetical protein
MSRFGTGLPFAEIPRWRRELTFIGKSAMAQVDRGRVKTRFRAMCDGCCSGMMPRRQEGSDCQSPQQRHDTQDLDHPLQVVGQYV